MENYRDTNGQFLPGHPGAKSKGDIHVIAGDVKIKIADFLNSKADELPQIWAKLHPRQKAQFFADLVPFLVAKQKELRVDFDEADRKAVADLFPLELDDPEWEEREALKQQLYEEHLTKTQQVIE